MKSLEQMTAQELELMSQEITSISGQMSDDELFEIIGVGLHNLGLKASVLNEEPILALNTSSSRSMMAGSGFASAVSYLQDFSPISKEEAKKEGKGFWNRFKAKLHKAICEDGEFRDLLTGKGTLKAYLVTGIPLVLAALGASLLNPIWLGIIAAVFAFIVKVGFEAYCNTSLSE